MKVGLLPELTHIKWVRALKRCVDALAPGLCWIETAAPPRNAGLLVSGDACYPFKKMVASAVGLLGEVDVLFIPRLVGSGDHLMCPNFRGLPDIVRLNIARGSRRAAKPVVTVLLEDGEPQTLMSAAREAVGEFARLGGAAEPAFPDVDPSGVSIAGARKCGERTRPTVGNARKSIALIGHPYVLEDAALNGFIPQILRQNGYGVTTPADFPFALLDRLAARRDYFAKKIYWRSAREIVGAFIHFIESVHPAGIIQIVPFNCGIDALLRIELMDIHRRESNPPPFMAVVCDEHTQRDHIVTRIEAFLDMIHGIKIDQIP